MLQQNTVFHRSKKLFRKNQILKNFIGKKIYFTDFYFFMAFIDSIKLNFPSFIYTVVITKKKTSLLLKPVPRRIRVVFASNFLTRSGFVRFLAESPLSETTNYLINLQLIFFLVSPKR